MNFIEIAHAIEQAKTTIAALEGDVALAKSQYENAKAQAMELLKHAEAVVTEATTTYETNVKGLKALYAQVQEHISGVPALTKTVDESGLKDLFLKGQALRKQF